MAEKTAVSVLSRTLKGLALAGFIAGLLWLDHKASPDRAPAFLERFDATAVLLGNGMFLLAGLIVIVVLALSEYCKMAARTGTDAPSYIMAAAGVLLLLVVWAGLAHRSGDAAACGARLLHGSHAIALALCIAAAAFFTGRVFSGGISGSLASVAVSMLGLVYIVLPLSFLAAVRIRWGVGTLFAVLAVCKLTDVGAYYSGKLIGGPRLAPVVSPNKTWAGLAGGVFFAVIAAVALRRPALGFISPAAAALFGLTLAAVAVLGDLAESLLKREAGMKDSARLIGGYGGILDMIDDILFAAPAAYVFLSIADALAGRPPAF